MRLRGFQAVLLVAAVLGGASCAGGAGAKGGNDGYVTVCEERAVTGTQIGRTRCHRKYDVDERARRDRVFMQHLQSETARRKITPPDQRIVSTIRHSGGAADSHGQNQQQ